MVKQDGDVMAFMDVLTHPGILRRRAAGNLPREIEDGETPDVWANWARPTQ